MTDKEKMPLAPLPANAEEEVRGVAAADYAQETLENVTEKETVDHKRDLDPTRYGEWEKNGRAIDF